MPTYISLVRYTQQGMQNIKDAPARLDATKQAAQSLGIQIKGWYLTMGQYDLVTIVEAPDDETVAKIALTVGMRGNVRTETLRAFTEEETRRIIDGLS